MKLSAFILIAFFFVIPRHNCYFQDYSELGATKNPVTTSLNIFQILNLRFPQDQKTSTFKVTIERKVKGANCTQGYILVNDEVIAYTLELPDKNNESYISSIPKDTYSANIRTDGDKGWRIELNDVPDRPHIEIHVGNYTRDTEGCILIGKDVNLNSCTVSSSKEAMSLLQDKFNKFTTDLILGAGNVGPINIQVEIAGI